MSSEKKGRKMQAMVFAAGKGTRLKPLTDKIPKALVKVDGKPLLEHVLLRLRAAGIKHIVVNVHHFSNQIIDYLAENDFQMDIKVSDETALLLDTGGGLKKARPLFDRNLPVLIHNVDILSNVDLDKFYSTGESDMGMTPETRSDGASARNEEAKGDNNGADGRQQENSACHFSLKEPIAALLVVSKRQTKRYLVFNDEMRLVGWTNIETGEVRSPYAWVKAALPQLHLYAFAGIHLFSPRFFPLMDEWPEQFPIMDFYLNNCDKIFIRGYVQEGLQLMDVGKQETLAKAESFLKELS